MTVEPMDKVREFAQKACEQDGCVLYDLEFVSSPQGRVLRIFIDKVGEGVSLEDCANVSRNLNQFLDENEDLVSGSQYDLEVSSPGLERRLKEVWHFERVVGKPVRVKTSEATMGGLLDVTAQTLFDGVLVKVEDKILVIRKDNKDWQIPFELVAKAHVRLEMPAPKGKKKR